MKEKEIEERVMIDGKQFLEIEKYIQENFPHAKTIFQKNRYFDDKDGTITKNHTVLRIRSFRSCKQRELTYKVKGKEEDTEYNQSLSHYWFYQITRFSRLPEGLVKEQLLKEGVDISSLKMLVELFTRRIEVKFDDYLFVLDTNLYNGICDYNIEIESDISREHAKEVILKYCKQFGLEYKDNYTSKSRRAFNSLNKN